MAEIIVIPALKECVFWTTPGPDLYIYISGSCDYAFQWNDSGLQVFVLEFFENHEGTNETDYRINDRILYYTMYKIVFVIYHRLVLDSCNLFLYRS